ncbi:aromatic acid exporter family protein [Aciduricibacillus chroicocephali]|uniref:Aromatic acid exporter family protein n=1 Tax=Aciduricibacillus chroicocephali TaxID=3054939 RepID=A0ABY9KRV3_9BACI|nr:aromatic acid exporter family protein [Bacillaceae bacterium 44XB]
MKIGYRTIKTAIGTPIAIWITQTLGVANFVSAGILTILCIQPSRKLSVLSAWDRFFACVLAILFSYVFFKLFGYSPIVIGFMLMAFIPVLVYFNITQGIGTSVVIILNIYGQKMITLPFLTDQFIIIVVGVGVGLLMNLYMPNLERKMRTLQVKLENNFRLILHEIATLIEDPDHEWDRKELEEVNRILRRAGNLVGIDKENHLLRDEHPYADYFSMRGRQFVLLQTMIPLVETLPRHDEISVQIADFFERLSTAVHPGNTADKFLEELKDLKRQFRREDLPANQEEFETRSNLFQLLHEIEDYLIIKSKFKKSDIKAKQSKKRQTGPA